MEKIIPAQCHSVWKTLCLSN